MLTNRYYEAAETYKKNMEIWGTVYLQFTNSRLENFKSELKIKKVHQLAITSLAGLYGVYISIESPRRVQEVLQMMCFIVDKAKDSSLAEYVAKYQAHYELNIFRREKERAELEQIMLHFAEKMYSQDALINMFREAREPCLPYELPEFKMGLIKTTLTKVAQTSKFLKDNFRIDKSELSFDEPDPLDVMREQDEKHQREQKDQEIATIVDKEINEFFNPKPFIPKEMLEFLAKAVGSLPLFSVLNGVNPQAADSINSSAVNCNSLNITTGLGSTTYSYRQERPKTEGNEALNVSEGGAKLSMSISPVKIHQRSYSANKRSARVNQSPTKWNTPLASHRSLCESVRKHAITDMQKKLGEAVLDSLNNTDEICRPLIEYTLL